MNPLINELKDFATKKHIADNVYIVGGAVRDMLSGVDTKDIDLAVAGDALKISKEFAEASAGTYVLLDSEFMTARVVKDSFSLDISAMRGDSIISDLSQRDITINAMAQPLLALQSRDHIIDPFGGHADLQSGIIRMVSVKNLISDPLRILRIYRFSAALHSRIEKETSHSVKKHGELLKGVAVERIAEELRNITALPDSHKIMDVMEENNIVTVLFPEFQGLHGISIRQGIECWRRGEVILGNPDRYFPGRGPNFSAYFKSRGRVTCLKLAELFSGDSVAQKAALRLKMSRKEAGLIVGISTGYKNLVSLFRTGSGKTELLRFLKDTQDDFYPIAVLAVSLDDAFIDLCNWAFSLYIDEVIPRLGRLRLITGDDLIREFGLSPSPQFKRILSLLEDDILLGKVSTREEALRAVSEVLAKDR
ncbi:MAG: CCA tRNA nucleotidyltransferase [Nitrospirae bacterium]|nr:CCA tRNA nucleotidyltransferase [Nitrospirota bacterium]